MITHDDVVACLTLEHLAYGIPPNGRLDSVLYIRDIDSKASGRQAVYGDIEIRLAGITLNAKVFNAGDVLHNGDHLVARLLEDAQIRP